MHVLKGIWHRVTTGLVAQDGRRDEDGAPMGTRAVPADPVLRRLVNPKVLVVDDEESIRRLVQHTLAREGREVFTAANGAEALDLFRRERPDITILDLHMPGLSGLEVLRNIRVICPMAIVMMFTGHYTQASVREAQRLGVTEFLQKGESFQDAWERRTRLL